MQTIQIVLICICAAMICAVVRMQRPELAMGISLAVGIGVVLMLLKNYSGLTGMIERIRSVTGTDDALYAAVSKAAGIAVISELGAQICSDAGEKALAERISLASRVAMVALCVPIVTRLLDILPSFAG